MSKGFLVGSLFGSELSSELGGFRKAKKWDFSVTISAKNCLVGVGVVMFLAKVGSN